MVSAIGTAIPVVMPTAEAAMPAVRPSIKHAASVLPMLPAKEAATGIAPVSAPEYSIMGTIPVSEHAAPLIFPVGSPVIEYAARMVLVASAAERSSIVRAFLITVLAEASAPAVAILLVLVIRTVHSFALVIKAALWIAHAAMPFRSANHAITAPLVFCFSLSHPVLWTMRVSGTVSWDIIAVLWFLGGIRWPVPVTIVRAWRWMAVAVVPVIITIVVVIPVVVIAVVIAVAVQHVIDILKDLDGIYDGADSSSLGIWGNADYEGAQ